MARKCLAAPSEPGTGAGEREILTGKRSPCQIGNPREVVRGQFSYIR